MPTARHVLLALLSIAAVYMVTATSASAHAFLVEGKEVVKGEHIAAVGSVKSGVVRAEGFTVECKKNEPKVELEGEGLTKSEDSSSECHVLQDAACKIAEPIKSILKSKLVIFGGKIAAEVTPETGTTFASSTASGCNHSELDGGWSLKGSQINELPEAEVEKETHEYVTKPSGSELTLTGGPGTFEAVAEGSGTTTLVSKKKWSAK
jgi:hypothetical protein